MNFIFSFFDEPAIIVGLMALIGLISLKKSVSQIVSGTLKTIIGFIIFQIGSSAIAEALGQLGPAFESAFHMQGVVPTNEAIIALVQEQFGMQMALIMAFGFVANLLLARFTPLKYVFLTGHHMLFMAGLLAAILTVIGFQGTSLIVIGSLLLGATMVITPALVQPFYRAASGSNSVAMGHYNALTYCLAALIARWTGNKEHSTEDIHVPENLSFFKDNVISTGLVMLLLFVITILLAEIIPAFKGISEKLVPNAIPALDCPVIFPFAPNAVIIGFLSSLAGAIVMFLILPFTGLAIIIPGLIPIFFVGAAAGVLTNAQGGVRGTIIGCFVNGAILNVLPAFLLPLLGSLGYANSTFGDADFVLTGIIIGTIGKIFSQEGIYALLAILFVVFAGLQLKAKLSPPVKE